MTVVNSINTNFAADYQQALRTGDMNEVENLFDDYKSVKADSNADSTKNNKAINSIKENVQNSSGDKKAQKKAQKLAEDLNGFYFDDYKVKKAKANGNTVEVVFYTDESNKKTGKATISFAADGSMVQTVTKDNKTTTTVQDSNGKIREKTVEDKKSGIKTVSEYDASGKINKKTETNKNDTIYSKVSLYDDKGKLSYETLKNESGTKKTAFEYNEEGKQAGTLETFTDAKTGETTKTYTMYDGKTKLQTTENSKGELETRASFSNYKGVFADEEAVNGQLDTSVRQGKTGDCWFLSALNSLNTTEIGKQIINDSITQNLDGSVTVEFKGVGISYTIPLDEIASNDKYPYSTGDNDALVLEIAGNKLRTAIQDGTITLPEGLSVVSDSTFTSGKGIWSGHSVEALYYLTGIEGDYKYHPDEDTIRSTIQEWINNPDTKVLNFALSKGEYSAPGVGEESKDFKSSLSGGHAYSIVRATEDTVTIVNPHSSQDEYTISIEDFINFGLKSIQITDLSSYKP